MGKGESGEESDRKRDVGGSGGRREVASITPSLATQMKALLPQCKCTYQPTHTSNSFNSQGAVNMPSQHRLLCLAEQPLLPSLGLVCVCARINESSVNNVCKARVCLQQNIINDIGKSSIPTRRRRHIGSSSICSIW